MSILDRISTATRKQNELPNKALAAEILKKKDKKAIAELVEHIGNKNKTIQSDCIKVLYEIGEQDPGLISAYYKDFITLLKNKNNRLVWGAMTAIDCITSFHPKEVYKALPELIDISNKGSVITRDHLVNIMIQLLATKQPDVFPLLLEQLRSCPTNQLPAYAEKSFSVISDKNKAAYLKVLSGRLKEIEKDSKRLRVEKVIKKLNNK